MNARELHDWMRNIADTESDADVLAVTRGFYETILRALDLLAATEGSEDAIVRELREQADEERDFQYADRAKLLDKAAAALVAMRAAKEKAEAERDELNKEWSKECDDTDALLEAIGLSPDLYRTDCGSLQWRKAAEKINEWTRAANPKEEA